MKTIDFDENGMVFMKIYRKSISFDGLRQFQSDFSFSLWYLTVATVAEVLSLRDERVRRHGDSTISLGCDSVPMFGRTAEWRGPLAGGWGSSLPPPVGVVFVLACEVSLRKT